MTIWRAIYLMAPFIQVHSLNSWQLHRRDPSLIVENKFSYQTGTASIIDREHSEACQEVTNFAMDVENKLVAISMLCSPSLPILEYERRELPQSISLH